MVPVSSYSFWLQGEKEHEKTNRYYRHSTIATNVSTQNFQATFAFANRQVKDGTPAADEPELLLKRFDEFVLLDLERCLQALALLLQGSSSHSLIPEPIDETKALYPHIVAGIYQLMQGARVSSV